MRHRSFFWALFFGAMLVASSWNPVAIAQHSHAMPNASMPSTSMPSSAAGTLLAQGEPLVKQGLARYHQADYANAIALWRQALNAAPLPTDAATLHRYLARAYQAQGDTQSAIREFDWLLDYYRRQYRRPVHSDDLEAISAADPAQTGQIWGQMLTEQAQNYSRMGHHPRAASLLCRHIPPLELEQWLESTTPLEAQPLGCNPHSAVTLARESQDLVGLAAALGSLSQTQRLMGEYDLAIATLQRGLALLPEPKVKTDRIQPKRPTLDLAKTTQSEAVLARNDRLLAHRHAMLDNLGNLHAAQAARNLRLAEFAQTKRKKERVQKFLKAAQQSNQSALMAFDTAAQQTVPDNALDSEAVLARLQSRLNARMVARRDNPPLDPALEGTLSEPSSVAVDWQRLRQQVRSLPASRAKVYALLKLATLSQPLAPDDARSQPPVPLDDVWTDATWRSESNLNLAAFRVEAPTYCAPLGQDTRGLLQDARRLAQRLQDHRAESFALGRLGHVEECQGNAAEALDWTRKARLLAPRDSRYRWDWQEGRILQAQGNRREALKAYEQTLDTLRGMRGELALRR